MFYIKQFHSACMLVFLLGVAYTPTLAQQTERVGIPVTGTSGITVSLKDIVEASRLYERQPNKHTARRRLPIPSARRENPMAPSLTGVTTSARLQENTNAIAATQAIHSNFLATGSAVENTTFVAPDCMGDVGPSQVLIAVNSTLKVYNKNSVCDAAQTTTPGASSAYLAAPVYSVNLNVLFSSVAVGGTFDPHIRYDRLSQRWFVVVMDFRTLPNRCCIAVSSGPVITGLSSFTFFSFAADGGSPVPPSYIGCLLDAPTLGVDASALYIGGNMFSYNGSTYSYLGASLFVVRKSSILGAGPMLFTAFHNTGTITTGINAAQGVNNDDPTATSGYFIGTDAASFNKLIIHRVSSPGGIPSLSASIPVTVNSTSFPLNPAALGSTALNAGDDRLSAAMIKKNKMDGSISLWTSHNIAVTATGVGSSSATRTGSRWYQISNLSVAPTVTQSGTLFDNATTNPRAYWVPSIAASGQGHALLGFSTAATNQFINCGIAGRYMGDAIGTLQTPVLATASSTAYAPAGSAFTIRWGDYSQTIVDPDDDMTMWSFQEYCNNTNSWGLRAIQAKAPAPAPITSLLLASGNSLVAECSPVAATINGATGIPEKFFDPGDDPGGPGFAKRLTVTCTGGITVSNMVLVSGTQINCNLDATGVPPGNYTLTVTNPDCQSVSTTVSVAAKVRSDTAGGPRICRSVTISPGNNTLSLEQCNVLGVILPSGAAPLSGSLLGCVFVDASVQSFNGNPYVQRHFDLEPSSNANSATATITLYFTQQEFDAYNAVRGANPALPMGSADAAGIANVKVVQFHGKGTLPGAYTEWTGNGPLMVTIDPADNQVVWDNTNSLWGVTFSVTGFSGFYLTSYVAFDPIAQLCPGGTITLPAPLSGTSYQWQLNTGSGFANISNNAMYSGVTNASLQIASAPSSMYGYQYRCVVNGVNSNAYTLKFRAWWIGDNGSFWDQRLNWNCGALPDPDTDVFINSGKINYPELRQDVTIRSLTVNPGASVTVRPSLTLTILK